MRMTRGFFLTTAASLVAVAAAQAADVPVKAKPVQYVKVCTLYGDGFNYIPGTDVCIKTGGYVRLDVGWNANGARTPQYSGVAGAQDRTVASLSTRGRADLGMDTRTQTQYGVLRTLANVHFQQQDQAADSLNVSRAYVQWAGFTLGRMKSYSDTFSLNDSWNIEQQQTGSDTGANGVAAIAYTADFGAGVTFDVGVDERRNKSLTNLSGAATVIRLGAEPLDAHQGQQWPDGYVALHIDETWGYLAMSGGIHDVDTTYYSGNGAKGSPFAGFTSCGQPNTTQCGHPNDKIGFFGAIGGELKLPMFGPGDRIGAGVRYSQGAAAWGGGSTLASPSLFAGGNNLAAAFITDGVYVNGSDIELTTAWAVQGGYDHHWSAVLNTTFIAGYSRISYNAQATSYWQGALCGIANTGALAQTNLSFSAATNTCNPNFSYLEAAVRTTWTPLPNLYFAIEGLYTYIYTGFAGAGNILTNSATSTTNTIGARPTGAYTFGNQGVWVGLFRVNRSYNAAGAE